MTTCNGGFADLSALVRSTPGLHLRSNASKDFALVKPFLTGVAKDWYQYSIPMDPKLVDPYFVEVARQSGGEALFGGGSDLVEMGLLKSPKLASPGEVNIIRPRSVYEVFDFEKEWTNHNFDVPAFGRRPAFKGRVGINGESGRDLMNMVENANEGKYLITDHPFVNVPFKHGHIVRVNEKGEARLYFRTQQDFLNYRRKILTLPDEDRCPPDFHMQLIDTQNNTADYLRNAIKYGVIVYARAAKDGWKYSPKSKAIIQTWVDYLKVSHSSEVPKLMTTLREAAESQGVSNETFENILTEFKLGN